MTQVVERSFERGLTTLQSFDEEYAHDLLQSLHG